MAEYFNNREGETPLFYKTYGVPGEEKPTDVLKAWLRAKAAAERNPEMGYFTGYKKAWGGSSKKRREVLITLHIPVNAQLRCARNWKARASIAKVASIRYINWRREIGAKCTKAWSQWDSSFIYRVGAVLRPRTKFCPESRECSSGIHFFMSMEEALKYPL